MTTQDRAGEGTKTHRGNLLRMFAGVVLFPFLWIGVALNFLGLAELFSFVPGISKEGGVISGVVALLLTAAVVGVLIGGTSAAIGDGMPKIGDGNDGPAGTTTQTLSPNPTATPTLIPSRTPSQTSTANPRTPEDSDFDRFKTDFRSRLDYTLKNDTLTGVSPLSLQYRETPNGTNELWLVYWECDNLKDTRAQRFTVGNYFANTAGNFNGRQPDRLVAYGVKNLETYNDSITTIPTSSAAAAYNRSMDPKTYTENYLKRLRYPNQSESEIAFQMTVNESGRTKAERAFHEHYTLEESDRGCPGAAESGDGGNNSETDSHVSGSGITIAAEPVLP